MGTVKLHNCSVPCVRLLESQGVHNEAYDPVGTGPGTRLAQTSTRCELNRFAAKYMRLEACPIM